MMKARWTRPLALWALGLAAVVGPEIGSASADPVLLGQVNFDHTGVLCTSESPGGGGQIPVPSLLFGLGHGLFPSLASALGSNVPFGLQQLGSHDFNADNSPRFTQVVQAATSGADDSMFTMVTLQIPTTTISISSTRRESEFAELNGDPDLVGSAVSFIRLVVTKSGGALEQCPAPQQGIRAFVGGRWEFWGTPASLPPTVALTPLGCTTCHVNEFAQFKLTITNPGPARTVEVKVASQFPDGVTVFSIIDPSSQRSLPAGGVLEEDLPGINIPAGLPFGTYILEAAILEPQLGETLARTTFPAQLVP
jgi:hypothetical protein